MAFLKVFLLVFTKSIMLVDSLKTRANNLAETYKKPGDRAKGFPSVSWCSATVTSNLGGLGPDTSHAAELRYANIEGIDTEENVDSIDIVVTALGSYKPKAPEMNGFNNGGSLEDADNGCFGIINLDDTNGGSSVDLEFKFVESGTNTTVHVEYFEFLLYDIDKGENDTAIESFTVYDDIDKYISAGSKAYFAESGDLSSDEGLSFTATTVGTGADNPTDPDNLTIEQLKKTVLGIYKHVESFKVTFSVTEGNGGRNFMFSGRSITEDDPEEQANCTSGSCVIWGDPHIITFDLNQQHLRDHPKRESLFRTRNWELDELTVTETGTFWLVNSPDIHMQGRYGPNQNHPELTSLDAFAVGGPFLNDNQLVFRPLTGSVTWNHQEILHGPLPSQFSNRFVRARYSKGAEMVKDGSTAPAIDVTLPNDVKLTVNRWATMLEVKIDMCVQEGQDGQCGNFNDNVTDDTEKQIMMRIANKRIEHGGMIERYSKHVKMIARGRDCRNWCDTHLDAWDTKCGWSSMVCSACEACAIDQKTYDVTNDTGIQILMHSASEVKHLEASSDAAPDCKDWCATHMDAWSSKCAWSSSVCSSCEACETDQEKHVEAATGECRDWCETHMDAWDSKCGWPSMVCSTCEACEKQSAEKVAAKKEAADAVRKAAEEEVAAEKALAAEGKLYVPQ